jgi:hypothetical protein
MQSPENGAVRGIVSTNKTDSRIGYYSPVDPSMEKRTTVKIVIVFYPAVET